MSPSPLSWKFLLLKNKLNIFFCVFYYFPFLAVLHFRKSAVLFPTLRLRYNEFNPENSNTKCVNLTKYRIEYYSALCSTIAKFFGNIVCVARIDSKLQSISEWQLSFPFSSLKLVNEANPALVEANNSNWELNLRGGLKEFVSKVIEENEVLSWDIKGNF